MSESDEASHRARRELERLKGEGGLFAMTGLRSNARSVRDHFSAADADRSDRVEVWGTRVGRLLGAIAAVALLAWLFLHLGNFNS